MGHRRCDYEEHVHLDCFSDVRHYKHAGIRNRLSTGDNNSSGNTGITNNSNTDPKLIQSFYFPILR
jgi:hypothetical protein